MMFRKIIPICIVLLFVVSCRNSSVYQEMKTIPESGWTLGESFQFRDSLSSADPEDLHFEVSIRHNNLYPYQNIWLYIQTKCSDGTTRNDSINWKLSEPNGRWLGAGWGSLYHMNYRLSDLKIKKNNQKRWFRIEIQHGLRDEVLKGIENVGVRLF